MVDRVTSADNRNLSQKKSLKKISHSLLLPHTRRRKFSSKNRKKKKNTRKIRSRRKVKFPSWGMFWRRSQWLRLRSVGWAKNFWKRGGGGECCTHKASLISAGQMTAHRSDSAAPARPAIGWSRCRRTSCRQLLARNTPAPSCLLSLSLTLCIHCQFFAPEKSRAGVKSKRSSNGRDARGSYPPPLLPYQLHNVEGLGKGK